MKRLIGGDDTAGRKRDRISDPVRTQAARLTHQQDSGGDIPRLKAPVPGGVKAPGGDISQVERTRTGTAETLGPAGDFEERLGIEITVTFAGREAGGEDGLVERGDLRNCQGGAVEMSATASFSSEGFTADGVVRDGEGGESAFDERDRYAEVGDPATEVLGAVKGIDTPVDIGGAKGVGFFGDDAVRGERISQELSEEFGGSEIGLSDDVEEALTLSGNATVEGFQDKGAGLVDEAGYCFKHGKRSMSAKGVAGSDCIKIQRSVSWTGVNSEK